MHHRCHYSIDPLSKELVPFLTNQIQQSSNYQVPLFKQASVMTGASSSANPLKAISMHSRPLFGSNMWLARWFPTGSNIPRLGSTINLAYGRSYYRSNLLLMKLAPHSINHTQLDSLPITSIWFNLSNDWPLISWSSKSHRCKFAFSKDDSIKYLLVTIPRLQ